VNLVLAHLIVKVPQPGDSKVTFCGDGGATWPLLEGWGRGGAPWRPNSRVTPQGLNQRS